MTIEHDLLGLPFEAHLYNILHELHIPSPTLSHSVLKFNVGERPLTVWQPSINDNDLPLLDFNLLDFFSLLNVEGVVDLVTCALLEHQIILKSSGKRKNISQITNTYIRSFESLLRGSFPSI
jgi:hypothetical protein